MLAVVTLLPVRSPPFRMRLHCPEGSRTTGLLWSHASVGHWWQNTRLNPPFEFSSYSCGFVSQPVLRLLRPFRHFLRSSAFQRAFAPLLLPISLRIPEEAS